MTPEPWRGQGLRGLTALTLAAMLLAVWGGWTRPGDPALAASPGVPAVEVWVADNGFHTDLILSRAALEAGAGPLAEAVRSLDPGEWVAVGWGDARFYVDARPIADRLPDGARAFLWPGNPSVVLLDPLDRPPERAYRPGAVHRLRLSAAGFARLRSRLETSLRRRDGRPVPGPVSEVGDGRFFEGVETFWLGHLCNHWTGELLHAAGLPVRPARTIFSAEIVRMALINGGGGDG